MSLPKLSKYIFFSFFFIFPFQTVLLLREPMIGGEKWQYGTIGLYGTDILLLVAIVSAVIASVGGQSKRKIQDTGYRMQDKTAGWAYLSSCITYQTSLILLVLWSGLSILWAPDQALAGYFFVKLLFGAGVFFLARSLDGSDVKTALKVLLVVAVIQAMIGIGQFVTQSTFSSSLLGMSAYEPFAAGTSVLKIEGERWLRAYGSFPHPNLLGGFLSAVLVLSIGFRVLRTKIQDAGSKMQDRISFVIYHASLILILLGLILTFSRAAWLGAALGLGALVVLSYLKSRTVLYAAAVAGMATIVFGFILSDQVFPRFDGATIAREGSVSERVQSLRDARTIIGEGNMLLGVGAGNFTNEVMRLEPDRPVWSVQPAHNVFALVFVELGAVGLVLFLAFILALFKNVILGLDPGIQRTLQSLDSRLRGNDKEGNLVYEYQNVIFAIAFLVLIPVLLLDHWLWSSHFGILFFFLLAGFVSRKD